MQMDEKAATGKQENGSTFTHAEELKTGERILRILFHAIRSPSMEDKQKVLIL